MMKTPARLTSPNKNLYPIHLHHDSLQNKDLDERYSSQRRVVHGTYANSEPGTGGGYFDPVPYVAEKETDMDPLDIQLDQNPERHRQKGIFGFIDTVQSSDTEDDNDSQSYEGSSLLRFNISWKCSKEGASKAETDIQILDGFGVLQSTAARDTPMLAPHFCATEDALPPTETLQESLPLAPISETARQTRVHESRGEIRRFMPPDRIIYFGVDLDSFRRGRIPSHITDLVISAARRIAKLYRRQDLGIGFKYARKPVPKVFDICYDPTLSHLVLAQAFFPNQPRRDWRLRIGPGLVGAGSGDYLYYIENVLAHEFAHILGLRHWDAGFNELSVPSVLWSGTIERCRESVMNTGVHPRQVRFSEEDFRVIREIYSAANGDVRAGRRIIDINPAMS